MTEGNKKENIAEELKRAREALSAAEVLFNNRLFKDAVSRLYYELYHTVRALLLSEGLEPKSHEGALRLVGLHFVKSGILAPADSHVFSRLMKYREEADYNPSYEFTEQDYDDLKKDTHLVVEKITRYLVGKGYIDKDG